MTMLRGVVHDPTARRMGGVAATPAVQHGGRSGRSSAGCCSSGGALGGARVLSPLTVARMTSPATPAGEPNVRGFGWDSTRRYSANRGELLPLGSFGHTGFTGTSIWIDPATRVFIVFLSNRVHPDGTGDVTPLRARVATIVASSLTDVPPTSRARRRGVARRSTRRAGRARRAGAPVLAGIDVLRADGFAALKGLRVGLLTNHTGRARDGAATIDLLASAPGVKLVALFSPEHGIRGILDAAVPSSTDEKTGLPIHSLYGDDAAADRRDAGRSRRDRHRSAGHRHALLHVHDDDGVRDGGGGGAEDQGRRARSAESDRRRADRRTGARPSRGRLHRLLCRRCRSGTA